MIIVIRLEIKVTLLFKSVELLWFSFHKPSFAQTARNRTGQLVCVINNVCVVACKPQLWIISVNFTFAVELKKAVFTVK